MYYIKPDLNLFQAQFADKYAQFEREEGNEAMAKKMEKKAEECRQRFINRNNDCRSGNYKSVLHYSNIKRVILQKLSQYLRGLYKKIANKLNYFKI